MRIRILLVIFMLFLTLLPVGYADATTINARYRIDSITMEISIDDCEDGEDGDDSDSCIKNASVTAAMGIEENHIISEEKIAIENEDDEDEYRYTFRLNAYGDWSLGDIFNISISYNPTNSFSYDSFTLYWLSSFTADLTRDDFGFTGLNGGFPPWYRIEKNRTETIAYGSSNNFGSWFASSSPWHTEAWVGCFHFTDGQDKWAQIYVSSVPVPEPASVLLLGSGLAGLIWSGRKRKKA